MAHIPPRMHAGSNHYRASNEIHLNPRCYGDCQTLQFSLLLQLIHAHTCTASIKTRKRTQVEPFSIKKMENGPEGGQELLLSRRLDRVFVRLAV